MCIEKRRGQPRISLLSNDETLLLSEALEADQRQCRHSAVALPETARERLSSPGG